MDRIEIARWLWLAWGTKDRPGLYLRLPLIHFALKRTSDEMFSERYGLTRTMRFAGLSLSMRRPRTIAA